MVQDSSAERTEETSEATPNPEESTKSLHIWMSAEAYEQIKTLARYAALEGLIEGHPRGNFTDYADFCFNLGEQEIKRYMLKISRRY